MNFSTVIELLLKLPTLVKEVEHLLFWLHEFVFYRFSFFS